MGMMIIRHKVRDYGQWRPIFDGHVEMQRAAALSIHESTTPPTVTRARSWSSSTLRIPRRPRTSLLRPTSRRRMIKAGVLDTPTIYFLESID